MATAAFVFVCGANAMPLAEAAFDWITGEARARSAVADAAYDSELRFLAVMWFVFGVALVASARGIHNLAEKTPALMAFVFLGGLGRLASAVFLSGHHPVWTVVTAVELLVPVTVWVFFRLDPDKGSNPAKEERQNGS
ncbi:MAG: DUF4345 domain-containing protein [Pseudomonadota bacterium]